jgi:hypothetical protein
MTDLLTPLLHAKAVLIRPFQWTSTKVAILITGLRQTFAAFVLNASSMPDMNERCIPGRLSLTSSRTLWIVES